MRCRTSISAISVGRAHAKDELKRYMMTELPAEGAARHEVIEHCTYAPGSDPRLAEITTGGLDPVPVIRQGAEELIGASK